ncbi:General transcription factor II-I-like [Oopsacas minuta]|uniref:General transcription factor II-I-like n=1 Tax=Oopsacas minuta TaxID=111878 RepID=A0AAV7JMG9_9METZ|nr:General transcription factor II-I-like [Oopsacas minuta]
MTEPLDQPTFRLTKSQRGGDKLLEDGYSFGVQRRVGDVTHWLCEQRGVCKARVHTKGMVIVKRTNGHSHGPDEQAADCCEAKAGMMRKARESQDGTDHIVSESLLTASEGTAAKLPKLDNLKRTMQRQRASVLAAPAQAYHSSRASSTSSLPADSQGRTVLTLRLWCRRCTQIPHLRDTTQPRDATTKQDLAS